MEDGGLNIQSEAPKSKKGVLIAVIAIAFIFLIAIGVAVYFLFGDKLFSPSTPAPVTPSPKPSPVTPSPPSGGSTGGTGGTGTGGSTPTPSPPATTQTYLYIREYAQTPYPSYLSVRNINNKMYLVANYMATQSNSLFDIDSSGGLMVMDMSRNQFRNISVNRTTSEMKFIDPSASDVTQLRADQVYLMGQTSNPAILQLKYTGTSYLSIIPLSSNNLYNVFGSSGTSQPSFTFVKRAQLDPIKPLYFSLSNDTTLPPTYLEIISGMVINTSINFLMISEFCYQDYDGKQIYNPNCQFYLDMSTFMIMTGSLNSEIKYISPGPIFISTVQLTKDVKRENLKFIAPNLLIYYNINTNNNVYLSNNNIGLISSTTPVNLGVFTQSPRPTPYVEIFSYNQDGNTVYLKIKTTTDGTFTPYLALENTEIRDKYFIKSLEFIMVFKDDKFKYIDLEETAGNYRLIFNSTLSSNTLRLKTKPNSSNIQDKYYIVNGAPTGCLSKKDSPAFGEYLGYTDVSASPNLCVSFGVEPQPST